MNRGYSNPVMNDVRYIHELKGWPQFAWDPSALSPNLSAVRNLQGRVVGQMDALGFALKQEASLETLSLDLLRSWEIEGEHLNAAEVRSSIARKLGLDVGGLVNSSRSVDGVVAMMLDATQDFSKMMSIDRLFGWHAALFPNGRSGITAISVGNWREDQEGPMQVVSGPIGRETIHFQAPIARRLPSEMSRFIKWIDDALEMDPVLKAGLAHLYFVTLHPFDDGNGRIARALTDMLLARSDGISERYYSVSSQMLVDRKGYYRALELAQRQRGLDVTTWLRWFLECVYASLQASEKTLSKVTTKHRFWRENSARMRNDRQRLMCENLLGDFFGKLTSSKWAKLTKCSQDTASRDIQDLIKKGILVQEPGGGRSTSYRLVAAD